MERSMLRKKSGNFKEESMKKRVISLVAAAALVGGMVAAGTAHAGTVATKGDTNISVYGFVRADFTWSKKMGSNTGYYNNVAYENTSGTAVKKAQQNKTYFKATGRWTRIGLKLNTPDIGVSGKIEADFAGKSGTDKSLRLRKAYLQHDIENYYIRVGKDANFLNQGTYTIMPIGMAGFGFSSNDSYFVRKVQAGGTFDLGQVTLIPEIAAQEMKGYVVGNSTDVPTGGLNVNRTTMPGVAGKLTAKIKTYFGSPITVYGGYGYEAVKLAKTSEEKKKHFDIATAGVAVPINWITLKADYNYFKGATGMMALNAKTYTPPSFYQESGTGDVKATKGYSWHVGAKVTPIPQFAAWGGYAMTKIKDADKVRAGTGVNKDIVKKNEAYYVGASYKTTKATSIAFEYERPKTTYQQSSGTKKDKGSQYSLVFKYNF